MCLCNRYVQFEYEVCPGPQNVPSSAKVRAGQTSFQNMELLLQSEILQHLQQGSN